MKKGVILLSITLLSILLISLSNALTLCNYDTINLNNTINTSTIICSNLANSSVSLSTTSQYFSIFPNSISPNSNPQITIFLAQNIPIGSYTGKIIFSDNSNNITVNIVKTQEQLPPTPAGECPIDIFPTILTNIKVQQGETKTRNIQINVPSCYTSTVRIQGVSLQTDEKPIILGELSLGNIVPGNSKNIPIEINAFKVSTGSYSDTLQLLLYNINGTRINVQSVSISVLVTAGISPITNFSLSQLPSCSLNAITLTLNSSYKLTCTVNPNIQIKPIIDTKYIKGKSVEETSTTYVYEFEPKAIGVTRFIAEYWYKNAPIGNPYEQEIRISSGNTPVQGTTLDIHFYQKDIKKDISNLEPTLTAILVKDTNTQSLVSNPNIYLNGKQVNSTFNLEEYKTYELVADAPGYISKTINFTVISLPLITISLNPSSDFFENTPIYVNTTPTNASIFLDGIKQENKVILTSPGIHTIEAIAENYKNTKINITIQELVKITSMPEFKKNTEAIILLSKNVSWEIKYAAGLSSQYTNIESGIGDKMLFTPEKSGLYQIMAEGRTLHNFEIKSSFTWFKWWYLLIIAGIVIVLIFIRQRNVRGFRGGFTDLGDSIVTTTPPM